MPRITMFILLVLTMVLTTACATQQTRDHDWYGKDKVAHFGVSAAIAAAVTNYKEGRGADGCDAAMIGVSVTLAVGASKEWYDKHIKKTRWSWEDFTYDVLGAMAGSLAAADC